MPKFNVEKIISWSAISKQLGKSRQAVRLINIPKKYHADLDKLFTEDIPEYWKTLKSKHGNTSL